MAIISTDLLQDTEKKLFWQNLTPKERLAYQRKEAEQRIQVGHLPNLQLTLVTVTDTTTQGR